MRNNKMLSFDKPFGIYIHIPFCAQKCRYCDFYSCDYNKSLINKYFQSLFIELENMLPYVKNKLIRSIYFGGGTPSLVKAKYIFNIIKKIKKYFNYPPNMEITLEANPAGLSEKCLFEFSQVGINRLSLGVQSFNDKTLKFLGRKSTSENNIKKIKLVKKHFNNYSLDLIFAVPGQNYNDFKYDLEKMISFNPPHLSLYNLQIEKDTELYKDLTDKKIEHFDQDLDVLMYERAVSLLKKNNYQHYEISNFAKTGYMAVHNNLYWSFTPYMALGPAASGFDSRLRYTNTADLEDYIFMTENYGLPNREFVELSNQELAAEYSFLNLRKEKGLSKILFNKLFDFNFDNIYSDEIVKLKQLGLIIEKKDRIILSDKGKRLGNEVFAYFLP